MPRRAVRMPAPVPQPAPGRQRARAPQRQDATRRSGPLPDDVDLHLAAIHRRVSDEPDFGTPRQVIAVRACEREGALGETGSERGRTAGPCRDIGEIRRMEAHAVARRHGHPRPVLAAGVLHGAFDPSFELHHLDTGPEQPGRGALEHALEKTFDIRDCCHRAEPYQSRRRNPICRAPGPTATGVRYLGRRTRPDHGYTLAPLSSSRLRDMEFSRRGPDDGDPHRVVLRTMRYPLHLRIERTTPVRASDGSRCSRGACATS